jgi:hypothetical protein
MVELGGDPAECPSGVALGSDVVDEVLRENARPSPLRRLRSRSSWLSLLGDQALDLVDRD